MDCRPDLAIPLKPWLLLYLIEPLDDEEMNLSSQYLMALPNLQATTAHVCEAGLLKTPKPRRPMLSYCSQLHQEL